MVNMTKRLVVIDGKSVFYRGYYAMPSLTLSDGTPTGGVFGFASISIEIIKQLNPDYIAVAWDIKGTSAKKRIDIYPEYKAGRSKPPEDFYAQLPLLRELLGAFGWPLYELDGYEADDIMGTFAVKSGKEGIHTDLISGDYDLLQLISPTTDVYITRTGTTDLVRFDKDSFRDKYGVEVAQFIDYKSLVGDSSDNIPGVRKIGPVAAKKLLNTYHNLDGVYANIDDLKGAQKAYLQEDKELAYVSHKLATIFIDAPIDVDWGEADIKNTDFDAIAKVLHKFEFNSLAHRLPGHMKLDIDKNQDVKLDAIKEKDWPETITIDGPVVLHVEDGVVWFSGASHSYYKATIEEVDISVWRALELAIVVSYDSKDLYHQLARQDIFVEFGGMHDIHQAAFLINPLTRDRSLSALSGSELLDVSAKLAAMWVIYGQQVSYFDSNPKLAKIASRFDFPLTYILFLMEYRGVKVDTSLLAKMSKELGDEHARLEQKMYSLVRREFNIASPKQLSEVLFTELNLPTAGIKKGKTGYSTGQKELDKLKGKHPIIELIEQTRELAKMKNTYVDTLPELVDSNNRVHTTYNQDVASTGRLSSTNPNMQNIPIRSELGKRIRKAFVPDGDRVFVSADYSQFELRLAAVLAGDKEMINDFNGDVDIHIKTASEVYGVPMDNVTKKQRYDAKAINFGVLYGMSPHGLSAATGMNFTEAKQFIDKYFELRAPIRKYIDETLENAKKDGYVETFYGRRRPTPDVHSSIFMVRSGAERAAINMPIQGTEADLMKLAMIQVEEKLEGLGEQILQVHDSIVVEAPTENVEHVSGILKDVMENIAPELDIKLRVDVTVGKDWSEV